MSTSVSLSVCLFHLVDREKAEKATQGTGQNIGYTCFIPMIYFYCSLWGPLISWLNYSLLLCRIMEVQVLKAKFGMILYSFTAACIFSVWNNMSGCENEGLLKEFERQKPPAVSVHTPHHINTHVHTCTPTHVLPAESNFAEFKDLSIFIWHICVRALMTDTRSIHHRHSPCHYH